MHVPVWHAGAMPARFVLKLFKLVIGPKASMKFGKQLEKHKVRGWEALYIDYSGLKRSLKDHYGAYGERRPGPAKDGASSSEGSPRVSNQSNQCQVSDDWFAELKASIDRVNDFFTSVADEAEARLSAGRDDLKHSIGSDHEPQLRVHLQSMTRQLQSKLLDLRALGSQAWGFKVQEFSTP